MRSAQREIRRTLRRLDGPSTLDSVKTLCGRVIVVIGLTLAIATSVADTPRPKETVWDQHKAIVKSCAETGAFEIDNEVYVCRHFGTLTDGLALPETVPVTRRQARLKKIFPPGYLPPLRY